MVDGDPLLRRHCGADQKKAEKDQHDRTKHGEFSSSDLGESFLDRILDPEDIDEPQNIEGTSSRRRQRGQLNASPLPGKSVHQLDQESGTGRIQILDRRTVEDEMAMASLEEVVGLLLDLRHRGGPDLAPDADHRGRNASVGLLTSKIEGEIVGHSSALLSRLPGG